MAHDKANTAAPLPTIRRMPGYLQLLRTLSTSGRTVVSGTHVARELGLEPIQVRKDLACLGLPGKPGVGFEVDPLIEAIESFLGWDNVTEAFLVGAGHLGSALMGFEGFERHGLKIIAAFDADPARVGRTIGGVEILPAEKLADLARRMHVRVAVLTVPAAAAQAVADELVAAGVVGLWNFSPVKLTVPAGVVVQDEDLARGLAVLSVRVDKTLHASRNEDTAPPAMNA